MSPLGSNRSLALWGLLGGKIPPTRSYPSGKKEIEIAKISLRCGYSRTLSVRVRVPSGLELYP